MAGLDESLGLQETEAPRFSRQSAHEGEDCQAYTPATFTSL